MLSFKKHIKGEKMEQAKFWLATARADPTETNVDFLIESLCGRNFEIAIKLIGTTAKEIKFLMSEAQKKSATCLFERMREYIMYAETENFYLFSDFDEIFEAFQSKINEQNISLIDLSINESDFLDIKKIGFALNIKAYLELVHEGYYWKVGKIFRLIRKSEISFEEIGTTEDYLINIAATSILDGCEEQKYLQKYGFAIMNIFSRFIFKESLIERSDLLEEINDYLIRNPGIDIGINKEAVKNAQVICCKSIALICLDDARGGLSKSVWDLIKFLKRGNLEPKDINSTDEELEEYKLF